MDMFALYTLVIVLSIIVVTVRKRFGSRSGDDEEESIHSNGSIRTQKSRSYQRQTAENENLRSMSIEELSSLNRRQLLTTDRYWREIFRRFNGDLPPDNINLNMQNPRNALTVLQEVLPRGGLHAAANSDIHCEVLKYLRKRYASSSEYQIEVDADNDTVTLIHSK
ncbi:hypothetical protein QR680_008028 [Steinernema hermaphroditum]|uniref:Uncharacterized protein n=1 Tax=Steinernema hermaphroditum TaxID=289476 RepID=A0AA39IGI3_9BILA|nr:hypothetical protein QR680_008028 [Steinernema hermaphroditum]